MFQFLFFLIPSIFFGKIKGEPIYIDQNFTSNPLQDGTLAFPFESLSIGLKGISNAKISKITFFLMESPFLYQFFDEYPANLNITIYSYLKYIFLNDLCHFRYAKSKILIDSKTLNLTQNGELLLQNIEIIFDINSTQKFIFVGSGFVLTMQVYIFKK